ncbi:MAG: hypothetical protein AAF799_28845 [Myxococcota bacterium]
MTTISVSTVECIPMLGCMLDYPADGSKIDVAPPYKVVIANNRGCDGSDPSVSWSLGNNSGRLGQGEKSPEITLSSHEQTLTLNFVNCDWPMKDGSAKGEAPPAAADDLTTEPPRPRVTVKLIKKGSK